VMATATHNAGNESGCGSARCFSHRQFTLYFFVQNITPTSASVSWCSVVQEAA
jgi:hypothetical protein